MFKIKGTLEYLFIYYEVILKLLLFLAHIHGRNESNNLLIDLFQNFKCCLDMVGNWAMKKKSACMDGLSFGP